MYKKIFFLIVIAIFLFSCNSGEEEAKQFSDEYTQVIDNLKTKRAEVKDRDQYVAYKADKKTALENLLKKHEKSPNVEKIEILRSKTLLKLAKLDDAEKKIDALLAEEPDMLTEAKMVKVQILLERKNFAGAHEIFKDIESKITNKDDLFQAYYYLGSEHDDNKIKLEYS
ncbi:MAG: hypothetical protein GY950_14215, partial [bacterium]|nr:hypothetical protein [bacterium]